MIRVIYFYCGFPSVVKTIKQMIKIFRDLFDERIIINRILEAFEFNRKQAVPYPFYHREIHLH